MVKVIARLLRLVTLLTVGLCGPVLAQTPDFSLPPLPGTVAGSSPAPVANALPPLPSTPMAPNAGAAKTMDATLPVVDASRTPATIPGAPISGEVGAATPTAPDASADASEDAAAAPEPVPEAADMVAPGLPELPMAMPSTPDASSTAPAVLEDDVAITVPTTPEAGAGGTPSPGLPNFGGFALPPGMPAAAGDAAAPTLPAMDLATGATPTEGELPSPPKPARPTWKTTLAPAIIPKKTNFIYRRHILPAAIYQPSYNAENRHLPTLRTREMYVRQLFANVAANNIHGTRALLNTGIPVSTTDEAGQSLLSVARRYGARDTERLLIARGAS